MTTGPIFLRVQHLAIGMRIRRRIRVIFLYEQHRLKLENEGEFSLVHTIVRNAPNFDINPPR